MVTLVTPFSTISLYIYINNNSLYVMRERDISELGVTGVTSKRDT